MSSVGNDDVVEAEILEEHLVLTTHQPLMSNVRCMRKDVTATNRMMVGVQGAQTYDYRSTRL